MSASNHHPSPMASSVAFAFFNEIGIIEQLSRSRFERVLPHGLSLAQFSVLNNFVRLGGERTPSGLASAFQVTRGAMTNTLQKLEAQGYIALRVDPADGRGKIVAITSAGRDIRDACLITIAPIVADVLDAFPEPVLANLVGPLSAIRHFLDENR